MIFEAAAGLIESAMWVFFQTCFHTSVLSPKKKMISAGIVTAGLTANIWLSDRYTMYSPYTIIIDVGLLFLYSLICLKGNWYWKLFTIIAYNISLFCCNFLCMAVFGICFHTPAEVLVSPGTGWRLGFLVATKLTLAVTIGVMLWLRRGINMKKNWSIVIILLPVLAVAVIFLLMSVFMEYYALTGDVTRMAVLMALLAALLLISFYLLKGSLQEREQRLQNQILQQQIAIQEQTYTQICENVRNVRKIQHDIKHRLVVAEQYLYQGDVKSGEEYLKGYLEELDQTDGISLEDSAWKTMISMKRKKAEERNIQCQITVQEQGLRKFQPVDFCVLLGNILDNAIEAEERICGERMIRLTIREEFGMILIRAENRTEDPKAETERLFHSSKDNAQLHGFGIPCIRGLVKKYGGSMKLDSQNGWFCMELWI